MVDTTRLAEDQARDVAEHRMTESKEDRSGNWFSRTAKRVWKHNLFQEYYRQKEIREARRQIRESGNIYAGEDAGERAKHAEVMDAVIDRFTSEYEQEMLREGERESKRSAEAEVHKQIKTLVKEFAANPDMSEEAFTEERNRILALGNPEYGAEGRMYADNLLHIAKEVRNNFEHEGKLADEDFDIELTLGTARSSLNTEAQMHTFDRVLEKVRSTRVGAALVNETGAGVLAMAAVYSAASFAGVSALRSNITKAFTFGAGAVAAGAVAGFKESQRMKRERAQHMRERAKGMQFEKGLKRREELEKTRYETRDAATLIAGLETGLKQVESGKASREDIASLIKELADIEARVETGDRYRADLIAYSRFDQVEQERTKLDLLRAKTKVALRKNTHANELAQQRGLRHGFDEYLDQVANTERIGLVLTTDGHEGIEAKDRIFTKLKNRKVAKTVLATVAIGAGVGAAAQEIGAAFNPHEDNLFEGVVKGLQHHGHDKGLTQHATALEALRRYMTGDAPRLPFGHGHEELLGNTHMQLPDGVALHHNADGTYDIDRNGDIIVDHQHIALDAQGNFTPDTKLALAKDGIYGDYSQVTGHEMVQFHEKAEDYIKHTAGTTRVHRTLWYDNDTPKPVFDKNELKEWWGGVKHTGVDAQGNYVFDMRHMMPKGSYHADQSVNAPETMKSPGLKMLFSLSRSTQHQVFEANINPDGTITIPKDSEIAKLMFTTDKHGHAIFNGQFAEVAQSMGHAQDGAENVRILSTYIGHGRDMVDQLQSRPVIEPNLRLDVPDRTDWNPPFIPVPLARTPLERGQYPNVPVSEALEKGGRTLEPISFSYGYLGPLTKEQRERFEKELSPTLKHNPDAKLDAKKEIKGYLEKESKSYSDKVKALAGQAGEMGEDCKLSVCIPVAGHQEENNIERTLNSYLNQTADPKSYEIVLFINQPETDKAGNPIQPDKTAEKVDAFQKEHPELQIRVMNMTLPVEDARIGTIRKLLNDATVLRSVERKNPNDLVIVSNDADIRGLAPEYVQNFITRFEENPTVDGMMGQLDWDPESYIRNPLVHVGVRLERYMEMQDRNLNNNISSSGANFAFRSSIYAAVGGYDANAGLAEDVELGRAIQLARTSGTNHLNPLIFGGARVSRLYTSSRRAELAMARGLAPVEQWSSGVGFSAFDDEVRKVNWESGTALPNYDDPTVVAKLIPEIETVINRTLKANRGWMSPKDHQYFLRRALGWLGVKYEELPKQEDGEPTQIKITDASALIEGLKTYQKEGLEMMNRKVGNIK